MLEHNNKDKLKRKYSFAHEWYYLEVVSSREDKNIEIIIKKAGVVCWNNLPYINSF